MTELKNNIEQMKEIIKRIYTNNSEKDSLVLMNQLKIINNAIPGLIQRIKFYKGLTKFETKGPILTKVNYKTLTDKNEKTVSLVIDNKDKMKLLENLSKTNSQENETSLEDLQGIKYGEEFERPNFYARLSNKYFRNISFKLNSKGYFKNLNYNLRKINSRFVVVTYVSMILLTITITFLASLLLLIIFLFFKVSFLFPFITLVQESILIRFLKFFWIIFVFPSIAGILFYFYPFSEAKYIGRRIDQELPFVTIHMSAIAFSGVEPVSMFSIILKSGDYKYTNTEFKKLINLINFNGESITNALRKISMSTPSIKLKELLNGLAVTIASGGEMRQFLNKHSENMLFDYKLESEKQNRLAETFMDIYISIAIAAPMIFLMIFVIIGSTGFLGNFLNLTTKALNFIIISVIIMLNVFFIIFLKIKQSAS